MKILADACVAGSLVRALRADGHDVIFAAEGPPLVPDETILEQARLEGRLPSPKIMTLARLSLRAA